MDVLKSALVMLFTQEKSTPMHLAARNGHTGAIRLLAAHNGDVNAHDKVCVCVCVCAYVCVCVCVGV